MPAPDYEAAAMALARLRVQLCRMETTDGRRRSTLARRYRRTLDEIAEEIRDRQAQSLARDRRAATMSNGNGARAGGVR